MLVLTTQYSYGYATSYVFNTTEFVPYFTTSYGYYYVYQMNYLGGYEYYGKIGNR